MQVTQLPALPPFTKVPNDSDAYCHFVLIFLMEIDI